MTAATGELVELTWPEKGVALVRLNRPERRNALNRDLLGGLITTFTELRRRASDKALVSVVLTGADPAFCAGLDLTEVEAKGLPDIRSFDVVGAIVGVGVPVIGAINGPAVTGGLEVALACDFRIASEKARFADTHARVGVIPGWGLTARLPAAVGQGWARQMSATGNFVDAALAERIGLVNSVVPHADLLDSALAAAREATAADASVLAEIRNLYDLSAGHGGQAALERERTIWEQAGHRSPEDIGARSAAVLARGRAQASGNA